MLILLCAITSFAGEIKKIPRPTFRTQILAFEDNVLFDTPAEGSLVYRTEGTGKVIRHTNYPDNRIEITGGPVSCIHPAQYDRPTLRLKVRITQGEPGIAICHNGMKDTSGNDNPSPGLEVVLREQDTLIRDLKTGRTAATIPVSVPRGKDVELSIAWDFDKKLIRIDYPQCSYQLLMPSGVTQKGGFALMAPATPKTSYTVSKIQVLWQDDRELVLYDGHDTVYDTNGKKIGRIPAPELPPGITNYTTTAVDLQREHSLILFGGQDMSTFPETFKGWAVRELRTGKLDILEHGSTVNGCIPYQGGGGMDGYWILQSWNPPASTCWLDWNAYHRGDKKAFIVPALTGEKKDQAFTGFHDPSNALDGSMARYLKITESWRGVNRLTVHPNLMPYSPFTDFVTAEPTHPKVSHTGPAGMPTQFAVRDRDRFWYEQWAYLGNGLHSQNRGYNVFTRKDDWGGKMCPVEKDVEPYEDYANMSPSLTEPGRLMAPHYRFCSKETEPNKCQNQGIHWLRWAGGPYVLERKLPIPWWPGGFQMLMDRGSFAAVK